MNEQQHDIAVRGRAIPVAGGDAASCAAMRAIARGATPAVTLAEFDALETALAESPDVAVLVPVRLPLDHLYNALQAGAAPDAALEAWCATHDALLRACRKARRRIVVVDAAMLSTRPADCAEALGERLGLRFEAVPEPQAEAASELSPVHSVIAAVLLAGDDRALALADELEAMIVGPASPQSPTRADISSAVQMVAALTEERDLLRENLGQMLEETERLLVDRGESEQAHQLRAQVDAANRQLEQAREALRRRDAALGHEILRLAAREREARAEAAQARDQVAQVYASTSWKVTGPLRAVRRGIGHA